MSIFNTIEEIRWEGFFTLLQWSDRNELNTMNWGIRPMISDWDKNIFMYRRRKGTQTQIETEVWTIYDTLMAELDVSDNAVFEWVVTWDGNVVFWNEWVVVEWYTKPHRVDSSWSFQQGIQEWSQQVMQILTDDERGKYPVSFNFRDKNRYHHIFSEQKIES